MAVDMVVVHLLISDSSKFGQESLSNGGNAGTEVAAEAVSRAKRRWRVEMAIPNYG